MCRGLGSVLSNFSRTLIIIFIISMPKYKNQPPFAVKYGNKSKIITFKNNEIIIRALVLLTLDIIAMFAFTTI